MIIGIQDFFYPVDDMKRAVDFYTQVLGMKVVDSNQWWTGLKSNGFYLGLQLRSKERQPNLASVPIDHYGAQWGGMLTLKSGNYLVDRKKILGAGVRIFGEHTDTKYSHCFFSDTENNVLRLMQMKSN